MKLKDFYLLYIYVSSLSKDEKPMQAAYTTESQQNSTFKFIGTNNANTTTHLISNNTSLISPSLYSNGGEDTCSFYSGPSDATIMAFGESYESCGSIAYSGETCGTVAYSGGGESCGTVASASVSSGGCSSGGGCSYSC